MPSGDVKDPTDPAVTCSWQWTPCPIIDPFPVHAGYCPKISSEVFGICVSTCENDDDCEPENKCCSNGCGKTCVTAIKEDTCAVSGYRDIWCLDKASADATAEFSASATDSTTTDASILPGEECYYRCPIYSDCSYDPSTTKCTWDDEYKKCWEQCQQNPTEPVERTCNWKTSCECLGDVDNKCSWCQIPGEIDTAEGTKPYVTGVCYPPTLTDKCSKSLSSGGWSGNAFTIAPDVCVESSTVDSSIKDTSSYFNDATIQKIFNEINSGVFQEETLQKYANEYQKDGLYFIVKRILKAGVTPDEIGTLSAIIEVNKDGGNTKEEICNKMIDIWSDSLKISKSCFSDCKLLDYTVSSSASVKRAAAQTSSSDYVHSVTVDPSTNNNNNNNNSAGNLAPIWMMLFALFLFFRM
jgi:hypothetical protein